MVFDVHVNSSLVPAWRDQWGPPLWPPFDGAVAGGVAGGADGVGAAVGLAGFGAAAGLDELDEFDEATVVVTCVVTVFDGACGTATWWKEPRCGRAAA